MKIQGEKKYMKVVKFDEDFIRRLYNYLSKKYSVVTMEVRFDKNKTEHFESCSKFFAFFDENNFTIDSIYICGKREASYRDNFMLEFGEKRYNSSSWYGVELSYDDNDNEELIRTVIAKIEEFIFNDSVWYGWLSLLPIWSGLCMASCVAFFFSLYAYEYYPKTTIALVVISGFILLIGLLGSIFKWKKKLFPSTQFWIKSNIKYQEKRRSQRKTIFGTLLGSTLLSVIASIIASLLT